MSVILLAKANNQLCLHLHGMISPSCQEMTLTCWLTKICQSYLMQAITILSMPQRELGHHLFHQLLKFYRIIIFLFKRNIKGLPCLHLG
uniref:Uncharacterized protein n=1 Tax=Salix viminalis TaxID=40686 RepID=A0A6N2MW19_SALVM